MKYTEIDILICAINNLSNNENINDRIYYGNNIIKQSNHKIDIWIILNEIQLKEIEHAYYYNSMNNSSISSIEILFSGFRASILLIKSFASSE